MKKLLFLLAACGSSSSPSKMDAPAGKMDAAVDSRPIDTPGPLPDAATMVTLTVKNYLNWCSVSVGGGTASTAAVQTKIVPVSTAVPLTASPASTVFELGPNMWHHVDADTGNTGVPGTVSGTTSSATKTTQATPGTACVWVCCPFTDGTGCPTTEQCP